jgi:predicted nucleic acid-binding protein
MSTFYLDTSVLLHVIAQDDGGAARSWFDGIMEKDQVFSSKLLRLETVRAFRRDDHDPAVATPYLARVSLVDIDEPVLARSESFLQPLRTLDAIHLATLLEDPEAILVSHDERMKAVAKVIGVTVFDPLA